MCDSLHLTSQLPQKNDSLLAECRPANYLFMLQLCSNMIMPNNTKLPVASFQVLSRLDYQVIQIQKLLLNVTQSMQESDSIEEPGEDFFDGDRDLFVWQNVELMLLLKYILLEMHYASFSKMFVFFVLNEIRTNWV